MANSLEITSHGYLSTILKHSYLRLIDTMTIVDDISPSVSTSTKNNQQLQQYELICAYSASGSHVAFAMNHNLTIGKINFQNSETLNNCSDEIIDLEFEANILIICWDIKERCLIIADDGGNLHFVTSKGQILFSKKITTGTLISSSLAHNYFSSF